MNKQIINIKDIPIQPGPPSIFAGIVHIQPIVALEKPSTVGRVTFKKSAHTVWHTHSGGQVLYFLEGKGRVQIDEKLIDTQPGDIVRIPPNTRHWHGAHPEEKKYMRHLAITIGENTWLEPVVEEVYQAK
jgi:quercetin dioxygenase-like cupin family protein